jgi:betaine-aldehyde dehydrogenase
MTTAAVEKLADGRMYIDGSWRSAADGGVLPCVDPSTEKEIAQIPDATEADVDAAVEAARRAGRTWAAMSPSQRAGRLLTWADRLQEHENELAEIDAVDSGNPVAAMLDDVRGACRELRMFAGLASEIKGDSVLHGHEQFAYGVREPYGVVGRIIPFNHPLKFAAGKSAAALVAGNSIVLKPSEHTSLSAMRLAQLSEDVLPPGVFNVVTGRGERAGAAIAAHPRVLRVAFTGGVPAGRAVMRAGAEHIKHVTMELGGKNPMIVFPDADPVKAAKAAVKGMNFARSQGQSCQSNSRVFVHEDVREPFTTEVVRLARALKVGNPLDRDTDLGPVAFRAHFERILGYIEKGREEGASLLVGGDAPRPVGFFISPSIFESVDPSMTIAQEEIFGPVLSLLPWRNYDEMLEQANDVPFGLTANIWTQDLRLAHLTAHRIEAGYVWINGSGSRVPGTPFGGYKNSGLGKESSLEEILEYTRYKVVAVGLQE